MATRNFTTRFLTYNVLSSSLSPTSAYPSLVPAFLDPEYRWKLVLAKIQAEMDNSAIIALQEVSSLWTGRIISLCQAADYTYISSLYGKQFNGYMGVGIAVPNSKFRIVECDIQKVSESVPFRRPLAVESVFMRMVKSPFRFLASLASFLWRETGINSLMSMIFSNKAKKTLAGDAIWKEALRRENVLVSLRLEDKASGGRVCVSNYHMPCAFWSPPVMMIHTALAAQRAQSFANTDPLVLAGDFNFMPGHSMYKLLMKGSVEAGDTALPPAFSPSDTWVPQLKTAMRSAYAEVHGSEPEFTNYTRNYSGEFTGTLDYVFLSPGVRAQSMDALPKLADAVPSPSELVPSDHWPLAGTLTVECK